MVGFDDVDLISAWDENQNRGQEACERFGMKYSPHIEDILNNPSIDLVMIGSETSRHAEHVEMAANSGKAILLQKPMAISLEDCDKIISAVERTGIYLGVAYQMRYDPSNQKIKYLVDNGTIGKVGLLRRRHCIPVLFNPGFINGPARWHIEADKNLGMFMDDASHAADFIYWVMGSPVSVIAEIDNVLTNVAPDDTGVAVYRYESGAMVILVNASVTLAGENTTEVYGDQGVLIQNHDDLVSTMVPPPQGATALKLYRRDAPGWESIEMPIPESHGERIMAVPRAFLDAFKSDKPPAVTAREGKVSVEMVLGAYQSAKDGKRISFPLA
jgi:predicted dehydrogenase